MTSIRKTLYKFAVISAAAMTLAGGAAPALAHDDAYLDTQKSANGGQLRMAGAYHFELVMAKDSKEAKENPIVVYVTDHAGTKIPSKGMSAMAIILTGKAKTTANLVADGDNRLKGMAKYASNPDAKVVLAVTQSDKSVEQARFTPFAAAKAEHGEHHHH
jgi:hypothetical protein